jgi:hypothetical protein
VKLIVLEKGWNGLGLNLWVLQLKLCDWIATTIDYAAIVPFGRLCKQSGGVLGRHLSDDLSRRRPAPWVEREIRQDTGTLLSVVRQRISLIIASL